MYNLPMARGSMRQRQPGVWDIQVSAGRDPVTGKRRRLSRRVYGSEREAERALTALQHEADTGKFGGAMASVATVVDRWWELHHHAWSPTTAARYRQILDQHVLPRWGGHRIDRLDVSELAMWLHALQHEPRAGRSKPLAPASVRQIRAVFRKAMKQAVQWGWLDLNPLDRTSAVSVPQKRKEADDPEQIRRVVNAAWDTNPDLAVWATVAATTGMRRSEMAALMWRDVDLETGVVAVHRALVQVGRQLHLKATKTEKARKLRLDPDTLEVLRAHRARADEAGKLAADALVWSKSPDGRVPVVPDAMTQAWRRLCRAEGVEGVRLHDLRHYMATQAILGGQNIAKVSRRLGHSSITTTLNIYTDHQEADDQDVADHVGSTLRREPAEDDEVA